VLRTWQREAFGFRWTPEGIVTQAFLDSPRASSFPAWPTGEGVSSRRNLVMLPPAPNVFHDTARFLIGLAGFLMGVIGCAPVAILEW
jgi:hypothetical protein